MEPVPIYGMTIYYILVAVYTNGVSDPGNLVSLTYTPNEDATNAPIVNGIKQNYPNPFNPETTISYSVQKASPVHINVYNLKGQKIKTLINEPQKAGNYTVKWGGKDDNGKESCSGIYFYTIETQGFRKTVKMLLLK